MATNAERARAHRIRAAIRSGSEVPGEDLGWLQDYEKKATSEKDVGASRQSRKISLDIDENSEAYGTGQAAVAAAVAGAQAREEGRRIDYLTQTGIDALVKACSLHQKMAEALLTANLSLQKAHLEMLEMTREQFLARTQAEIDAMNLENEQNGAEPKDATNEMIAEIAKPLLAQMVANQAK